MQPESISTEVRFIQLANIARRRGRPRGSLQRRVEHLLLEALVVFAHHGDLQFLARAEVGEDARLAHLRDFGQRADRQAFQADLRGQAQGRVDDGRLGLLALLQGLALAGAGAA